MAKEEGDKRQRQAAEREEKQRALERQERAARVEEVRRESQHQLLDREQCIAMVNDVFDNLPGDARVRATALQRVLMMLLRRGVQWE